MVGADPEGSVLSGDIARTYLTEGVGEDFFPGTFDRGVVDRWVRVPDADAFATARRVAREEGILVCESSGTAVAAALLLAAELVAQGRGCQSTIVVVRDRGPLGVVSGGPGTRFVG